MAYGVADLLTARSLSMPALRAAIPSRSCSPCARPAAIAARLTMGCSAIARRCRACRAVGHDGEAPFGNAASLFTRRTLVVQFIASINRVLARRHPVKLEDGQQKAEQCQGNADHAVVKEKKGIHWVVLAE